MPAILIHVPATPSLDGQPRLEHMSRMQQDLLSTSLGSGVNGADGASSPKMLRRLAAKTRKPRVAIVGAGFAGLRAADVLLKHGAHVTIFEARSRIGGRLYQDKVGDHLVDMGPNWIHGTQNNPILDLVRATNTTTHDWDEQQVAFGPDGTGLDPNTAAENAEIVWSLIGDAFKHSNENSGSIDPRHSLKDYIRANVDEKLYVMQGLVADKNSADYSEEAIRRKSLILKLAELWGGFIGATTGEQSLKFLWLEECLEGENLFCAGTYQKVLEVVSKPALKGADWRLDHVVDEISSTGDGDVNAVTIGIRDGCEEESFDEVIITCPLGWLKRNKNVFKPELPARISQAIDSLGYGNLDKVYITFPNAWWECPDSTLPYTKATASQNIENGASNVKAISAAMRPAQDSSGSDSANEHYASFTTFIAPEYAPESNPEGWFQDCINLAALPEGTEHPTLLFYISGPTSDHIAKILSKYPLDEEENAAALKSTLGQFFFPYLSKLPNFSVQNPDCQPSDILATGWTNDEFAGYGSYSMFPAGAKACDKDIEAMRDGAGLVERGIWLAGEHTAPFVASGTVTGAYWSGEKVATRIAKTWELIE